MLQDQDQAQEQDLKCQCQGKDQDRRISVTSSLKTNTVVSRTTRLETYPDNVIPKPYKP